MITQIIIPEVIDGHQTEKSLFLTDEPFSKSIRVEIFIKGKSVGYTTIGEYQLWRAVHQFKV